MRRIRILRGFVTVVLRGLARDRTALFFMLVLPVAIIVIIGATFGGVQRLDIGVVQQDHGLVASAVVTKLRSADGARVHSYKSLGALREAVRRNAIMAGIVLLPGLDQQGAGTGELEIPFVTNPASAASFPARSIVDDALSRVGGRIAAARLSSPMMAATPPARCTSSRW